MNTFAFRALGASAVLVVGLAGCSAPAAETSAKSTEGASAAPVESVTPTPTPKPTAKAYTTDELAALVGQLKDSQGVKLSVMSIADMSGTFEQTKALMSSMVVEPAACQEMAVVGMPASLDGASAAIGTSLNASVGITTITMASGLDPVFLEKSMAQAGELSKCASMTFTTGDVRADMAVRPLDGVGSVPGTFAFESRTSMSNGQKQSMVVAQAVSRGVKISVISMGGASQEGAVSRTGAMMDQAAALLK